MQPNRHQSWGYRSATQQGYGHGYGYDVDHGYNLASTTPSTSTPSYRYGNSDGDAYRYDDYDGYYRNDIAGAYGYQPGGGGGGHSAAADSGYAGNGNLECDYRDYDGYREQDHHFYANRGQNRQRNYYDGDRAQAYPYSYADRSSGASRRNNNNNNNNNNHYHHHHADHRYGRRDRYGDQRRTYHSTSSSRYPNAAAAESSSPNLASASASGTGSLSSSLADRLFRHRESVSRVSPVRQRSTPYADNNNTHPTSLPPPPLFPPLLPSTSLNLPTKGEEPMNKKLVVLDKEYLQTSLEESRKLECTAAAATDSEDLVVTKKLLVLDLNGTLVYRSPYRRRGGYSYPLNADVGADVSALLDSVTKTKTTSPAAAATTTTTTTRALRAVHPRPYLASFRDYLFHPSTKRWLDTMVWSSAQPHSVEDMVGKCFGEKKSELVAVWARDRLGLSASEYTRRVQTTKDLRTPWKELKLPLSSSSPVAKEHTTDSSSSSQRRMHSARTTLLLDDSTDKAHLQPYNHLCVKEYDVELWRGDLAVRDSEVAREKYADVLAGKQTIDDVLEEEGTMPGREGDVAAVLNGGDEAGKTDHGGGEQGQEGGVGLERKRKRKEKKESRKKERIENQIKQVMQESQQPGVYDETLLAVVGILDAAKGESNIAAWIRGGALMESLPTQDEEGEIEELASRGRSSLPDGSFISVPASGSGSFTEKTESNEDVAIQGVVISPREGEEAAKGNMKEEDSALRSFITSDDHVAPPPSSSPLRETSPAPVEEEAKTERTSVPVFDQGTAAGGEQEQNVRAPLWCHSPDVMAYWALRGRKALEALKIEIVPGVVGYNE